MVCEVLADHFQQNFLFWGKMKFKYLHPRSGNIDGDPEGVTLYKTSDTDGYIILSNS